MARNLGELKMDVTYDWDDFSLPFEQIPSGPAVPKWLENLFGGDFFSDVAGLYVHDNSLTDGDVTDLKCLTQTQEPGPS